MAPHAAEVIASDLSSEMIAAVVREAAQRDIGNIATVKAAAESLPFDSGHFDAVVSRFSAHHWGDFTGGLREAARVLKAGAKRRCAAGVPRVRRQLKTHCKAMKCLRVPAKVPVRHTPDGIHAI